MRTNGFFLTLLLVFPLVLSGCGGEDGALPMGDLAKGARFAESHCGACHATGKEGASPYAPAPPFRTLHEKYRIENLAEALAEGLIVNHQGLQQMPEVTLSPEEIDNFLAFLQAFGA